MLRGTLKYIKMAYLIWEAHKGEVVWFGDEPADEQISLCSDEDAIRDHFAYIEVAIARDRDKCHSCIQTYKKERRQALTIDSDLSVGEGGEPNTVEMDRVPEHLRGVEEMKHARNRHTVVARAPPRLPNAMDLPPQRFQWLMRNRCLDYDDYFNGPVLDDLHDLQRPGGVDGFPLDFDYKPTVHSSWERFKDYGYRIEPEFSLMFNQQNPLHTREHALPPPIKEDSDQGVEAAGSADDSIVMGMEEMMEEAGEPGSVASMMMFVCGRMVVEGGDKLVIIDPLRDAVPIKKKSLHLSGDIDSFIWTCDHMKTLCEVGIHVLPYTGKQPPIYKSNHAFVEIINPQSQADKDQGPGHRQEWFSTRHSLSAIPHTHFAKIAVGNMTINISVFFPRMKHRDPLTGKRATLIPFEIQSVWLTQVVYPAILQDEGPSAMPYKDYTLEEWRWKAESGTRTVTVTEDKFLGLQQHMLEIIDGEDDLDRFASHFFVMDGRGMKESTMVEVTAGADPVTELCTRYPQLDWDYMMQREHGQLLLDLGMAYNMEDEEEGALTALWDLRKVRHSYAAGGMNAPTIHHTNTLARYGGMQAEMGLTRSRTVQLCFRSTYGLYYQPVRRGRGGDIKFCTDADAYHFNSAYKKSVNSHIKMLRGSKKKSFGVREELRGSGAAIQEAIGDIHGLVSENLFPFLISLEH
jgi:hypothetical protein